jgi:hypothetical protein
MTSKLRPQDSRSYTKAFQAQQNSLEAIGTDHDEALKGSRVASFLMKEVCSGEEQEEETAEV